MNLEDITVNHDSLIFFCSSGDQVMFHAMTKLLMNRLLNKLGESD